MKLKFLICLFVFFFLSGCGFTVLNQQRFFNIEDLQIAGEKRIAFILKNDLNIKPIKNNLPINLKINAEKEINVKEKNNKNEITKYEITLIAKVEYSLVKTNDQKYEFVVKNKSEYSVASQHSNTLRNEKLATDLLAEDLSNKILDRIGAKINDL